MYALSDLIIGSLFAKAGHGVPMRPLERLALRMDAGIIGSATKTPFSPRQVCVATYDDIRASGIDPADARVNVALRSAPGFRLMSGNLLRFDETAIRLTFACEVCSHGAKLADAPMRQFRQLNRMMGLVLSDGDLRAGETVRVTEHAFDAAPDVFVDRCAWMLDRIPRGFAVAAGEFLIAIGASASYHRVLPRWMNAAARSGRPVHRVLAAGLTAPSWAPDALATLHVEGAFSAAGQPALYPLVDAVWRDSASALQLVGGAARQERP